MLQHSYFFKGNYKLTSMRKIYLNLTSIIVLLTVGTSIVYGQSAKEKAEIRKHTNVQKLEETSSRLLEKSRGQKEKAIKMAEQKGWQISGKTTDGAYFELMRVAPDGTPVYYQTFNVDAAKSTRANTLHSGGVLGLNLNGENMKAYIWDGGHVLTSHQEYVGQGGINRVGIGDTGYSANNHAGHVLGTVLASGYNANAKGMAPKALGYSYEWNNDSSEASTAASDGMILSNHSYGFRGDLVNDQYFGAYIDESKIWDEIMYNAPYYLMVVAAGNDGDSDSYNAQPLDGYSAYDKLTGHSISKNNIVVANAQDASVDAQGNLISASRYYSSSEGPTDDYRIKPDIAGNGYQVYSSDAQGTSSYQTMTGTSMASPNVMGTLLLLQQHHRNLNNELMKASTLKGLALHTADDISPVGPDAETGWGLLNAKAAAEVLSQEGDGSIVDELTLNAGDTYTLEVEASELQDLVVSISWTDPAGQPTTLTNSNTAVLVNDLDLTVTKDGVTYSPWKLTGVTTNGKGDNDRDPFERVDISNPSGTYTINISHKGTLTNGSQNYSLIVSGLKASDNGGGDTVCKDVSLALITDNYGAETTWDIKKSSGGIVASGNGYASNTSYDFEECLSAGCYTFTIYDSYGDGICCVYGDGSFTLTVDGEQVATGGDFNGSKSIEFCIEESDLKIDSEAPSDPTSLAVLDTTISSVDLSWSASTDNVGVTGYNIYRDGSLVGNSTSTAITINSLQEDTTYTFSVTAVDAIGNESSHSNTVSATTLSNQVTYCDLKGNNSTFEWIDHVALGDMSNTTTNDNGYGDYTNKIANVGYGDTEIRLSANFGNSVYSEKWYVWIDLNRDGTFADSELLYTATSTNSQTFNGTINIPSTAVLGKTRMRVAMIYNSQAPSCGTFSYGEVEDYTVNIGGATNNSYAVNVDTGEQKVKRMEVYPNPVKSGYVMVKSSEMPEGSFEVISMTGKLIKFGTFSNGSLEINVDDISTGKYFIRLSKDGKRLTEALLVN